MWLKLFLLSILCFVSLGAGCVALSLEGGGSRGAYEAGVVSVLVNSPLAGNTQWNVVTGVSIGAINAGMVAMFAQGNEKAMSDFLTSYWLNITGDNEIYVNWPGGLIEGLLFQRGIYDNEPAKKLAKKIYTMPIVRNMTIGSTNLDSGLYGNFNESIGNNLVTGITCSASPPFFFEPQAYLGDAWADGGCIINLDVFASINRCLDVTNNEKEVTVDLIYDNPYNNLPDETEFKTLEVLGRVFDIRSFDSSIWYTYNAMNAFPDVNFRYVIKPSMPIPGGIVPLNFTPSVIQSEIQLGINDTIAMLNSTTNGRTVIQELFNEKHLTTLYP